MILILIFSLPAPAIGQMEFVRSLGPEIGRSKPVLQYQVSPYSKEEVEGQSKDFGVTEHAGFLLLPVLQNSSDEWSFLGAFRFEDIQTDAFFPDTGEAFPRSLWDVRLGTQYRHKFSNGWIGGGVLTLGSASDKPFQSEAEVSIQATIFARIPDSGRNGWIFFLNYSRYREFLPNVPIPGIAYWFEPSPELRLIVGIPFANLEWKPVPGLTAELIYFAVRNVRAQVSYRVLPELQVFGGFEWKNEHYFRYDRQNDDQRLSHYEKRVSAGIRWGFFKGVFLELASGYAFDRFYFEGESYDDRYENRLNIGNGFFGTLRLGATIF